MTDGVRRSLLLTLGGLGLTGCAAWRSADAAGDSPTEGELAKLIGLRLRVVRPGEMVTMDFVADRLTGEIDDDDRIVSARIG